VFVVFWCFWCQSAISALSPSFCLLPGVVYLVWPSWVLGAGDTQLIGLVQKSSPIPLLFSFCQFLRPRRKSIWLVGAVWAEFPFWYPWGRFLNLAPLFLFFWAPLATRRGVGVFTDAGNGEQGFVGGGLGERYQGDETDPCGT